MAAPRRRSMRDAIVGFYSVQWAVPHGGAGRGALFLDRNFSVRFLEQLSFGTGF